jgi:hypothetical protein
MIELDNSIMIREIANGLEAAGEGLLLTACPWDSGVLSEAWCFGWAVHYKLIEDRLFDHSRL